MTRLSKTEIRKDAVQGHRRCRRHDRRSGHDDHHGGSQGRRGLHRRPRHRDLRDPGVGQEGAGRRGLTSQDVIRRSDVIRASTHGWTHV
ncbi:hypothetical protein [Nocardioides sp. B-3]|uniref:hypothetical protein n=1 Tax=Nocardioides sp. B-3 TaxID=2895565 RepID=UPI0021533BC5|nr:hypothetical protein [Nocardioides sp. B-3]UUZ58335.1 hypothetical protein LP418_19275 [Nocardioides sp. B-3]